MSKRLNETRTSSKLIGIGCLGEVVIEDILKKKLSSDYELECLDDSPYLPFDITIINKKNKKKIKLECESFTGNWEDETFSMLDTQWFYGFNIPARKFLELDFEQIPKKDNSGRYIHKKIDFVLFLKINKDGSRFFSVKPQTIFRNLKNNQVTVKKIPNKYDKASNTNHFIVLNKKVALSEKKVGNFLVDDWDKLVVWIQKKLE